MGVLQINVLGVPLDLSPNEEESFYITKQLYDLNDLETRNANFSKGIILPLTPRNKQILGNQIPTLDRFDPSPVRNIPAEVLMKGVPIFQDAFLIVGNQNPDKETLKITVVGGTAKFFNQLSFDSIALLDFSELDLTWDLAGVSAIAANTTGIAYLHSFWYSNKSRRLYDEQNGNDLTTSLDHMELGESGFWMFFHTILNKIFSNLSNITVDTSKMDTLYNETCLAVPVPIVHDGFESIEGSLTKVEDIIGFVLDTDFFPDGIILLAFTKFNNVATGTAWDPVTFQFDITEAGLYNIYCNIKGLSYISQLTLVIQVFDVGSGTWIGIDGFTIYGGSETVPVDAIFALSSTADMQIGQAVRAVFSGNPGTSLVFAPDTPETSMSIEKQGGGRGRFVSVSQMLPDISQRNFVKEVFKLFNIIPSEKNNVITLEYFESIKNNAPKTIEFNKTLDLDVEGLLSSYGQNNIIKYEENPEVERKDADSSFLVNSSTLAKQLIKIESLFSATDVSVIKANFVDNLVIPNYTMDHKFVTDNRMTVQSGGVTYATADRNDILSGDFISIDHQGVVDRRRVLTVIDDFSGTVDVGWSNNKNDTDWDFWTYAKEDVRLHIGRPTPDTKPVNIWDGGTVLSIVMRPATFEGLKWNELSPVYYKLLFDSVFKPFVVRGWTAFGVIKFLDLTGIEPIYIAELDAYFYMNKLEQYKFDGQGRMELIQLAI